MSWAAHEFENYFIQKHVGTKASFLGIVLGAQAPDLFTKSLVYAVPEENAAMFHRGWPGVGFTHSLMFGVLLATVILVVTKSRAWSLGALIGVWAHVLTEVADSAGVMVFFPFSTEPVTINMWKHAASEGRYGDAVAYFSSLGGVSDLFWLVITLTFAWRTLGRSYFRDVIVVADPRVWGWLYRTLRLPEDALLLLYRGLMFYGVGRLIAWFFYARFGENSRPLDISWGGPSFVAGNDISDTGWVEVLVRTGIGGVLFVAFLWLGWKTFGRRLWERGYDIPVVERGRGIHAIFEAHPSRKRRSKNADRDPDPTGPAMEKVPD